jgi:hypothetical protein
MAEIVKSVPLKITIGSYPTNSMNLDRELKLLKAAILYGDQVELYSLKASMIGMILKLKDIPSTLQIRLLEDIFPYINTDVESAVFMKNLQAYKEAITRRPRPRHILIMQQQFAHEWLQVKNLALKIARASGFQDLERAIDAGVLELHTFETANNQQQTVDFIADCVALASHSPLLAERRPKMEVRTDLILQEFVQGMITTVSEGGNLPLFDEQTSSLVDAGVREGIIIPSWSTTIRAKHSALAANLLERIPLFEDASVDQVLGIRRELDRPLVRFRSALIKFSETIKSAAWDKDFPSDAETVFMKEVAPAILDIEDASKSNKFVVTIIRGLAEKPLAVPSGSLIGLAISTFSGLPEALAISLGAGVAASTIIFDAYKAWSEKNLKVQQNTMYFYYQAAKKLDK